VCGTRDGGGKKKKKKKKKKKEEEERKKERKKGKEEEIKKEKKKKNKNKKRRSTGKRTRLEGLGKTTGITMKNCNAIFTHCCNNHGHNTMGGIPTTFHNIMYCTQCGVRDTNPET
jgi:hypothetical protein